MVSAGWTYPHESVTHLKQMAIAMHEYHEAHGHFPSRANFDESGRALLSWRVHLLLHIDQEPLYRQFRLDEPWDSEHNRQLIPRMPPTYRNPRSKAEPGKANYLVPVGKGTLFEGQKGTAMGDVLDGLHKTILVLEANDEQAVIWTKPDDWQYDPERPLSGLGKAHPGGFLAAFGDCSVHFLLDTIDPVVFRRLITFADCEPVGDYSIFTKKPLG